MNKILCAGFVALSFLAIGAYLLLTIPKAQTSELFWDFEEYCDEEEYLKSGCSLYYPELEQEELENLPCPPDSFEDPLKQGYLAIEQHQSLHEIFRPHNVSNQEIAALTEALNPYLRARDIAVGDFYKFTIKNSLGANIIESFEIQKPDQNRLPISYEAKRLSMGSKASFDITKRSPKISEKTAFIEVQVKDTLFGSFSTLPFGHELMQRVMLILAWRLRLPEKVTQKDTIKILVQQNFIDKKFLGYGNIEAIIYEQANQTVRAFYFSSQDKKISGYYDETGASLEKELMTSPARITVATSNQSLRLHPVYKSRMKHNGTDFRGPIGTPFHTIGAGEIIEMRFDKNVGNMIRIKHKNGIYSEYFHADSLVSNLKVGDKVVRGQKIGEIGRTGRLCTGPHLHLGLYKLSNEKRHYIELSSLRNLLADHPRLSNKYLSEFNMSTQKVLAQMQPEKPTMPIANKHKNSGEISKN